LAWGGRGRAGGGADAIVGVTYFSDQAPEEFGALDRAVVALFRLPAGDAWVTSLSPLDTHGNVDYGVVCFVNSFVVVVNWTLLPVTLAIMVPPPPTPPPCPILLLPFTSRGTVCPAACFSFCQRPPVLSDLPPSPPVLSPPRASL
jgi:hypothetical protein